ncbi:MAG TPA: hypothetical protein VHM20_07685, partial [Gammaproteobacteria bacterium]|nr:hypothetical protein [Gammaproteobacteria bacterium]
MQNSILTKLLLILTATFGRFHWNPPFWVQNPQMRRRVFMAMIGVVIVCILAVISYHWYQKLPKPELITAQITIPKATPLAEELTPEPLSIHFGVDHQSQFDAKSVAPLNHIEREVTENITVTPEISGSWYWESDNHLTFTPLEDWLAGQTYTVHFKKNFFAANVKMA